MKNIADANKRLHIITRGGLFARQTMNCCPVAQPDLMFACTGSGAPPDPVLRLQLQAH